MDVEIDASRSSLAQSMRAKTTTIGAVLATTTAVAWGGQFVVGKSALGTIDAFPLSTIRYAAAVVLWGATEET